MGSEVKFTPGPWIALPNAPRADDYWRVSDREDFVCQMFSERCEFENAKANAHLIAAAPDLYEALKWIADQYANQDLSHVDFRVEAARRAEAALSKAQPTNPTAQGDEQ